MTHKNTCSYCGRSHTALNSDVVCDSFTRQNPGPVISLLNKLSRNLVFYMDPTPKKKYVKLSTLMSNGIRDQYKKAKR